MKDNLKKHLSVACLVLIIFLAALLRFYQLGNVPPSPDWDEASLGYNAYSILTTGKDEYGQSFPLVLRSFDDYKPALYSYFIIPFIPIFDLSVFTVRLPSALFGVLAVLGVYLLAKELFSTLSFGKKNIVIPLALTSALMLAISPWDLQFSRIAFESQVGMAINILVFFFFLKGIKKPKYFIFSFILAALNIHIYQSNRVFSPLLVIVLSAIYFKDVLRYKKWFIIGVFAAFLVALPFVYYSLTNSNALLRAKGVSIFSDQSAIEGSVWKLSFDNASGNTLGMILNNRRIEFAKLVASGYISHFNFSWLFISGDIARHHAPFMGLLYIFEIPTILVGLYILLFSAYDKKKKIAFFAYLLLVPIPASITSGVPHAVRTLNFVPIFSILSAVGIVWICLTVNNFKFTVLNFKIKYLVYLLFLCIFFLNFFYFLNQYFVQQNYYTSKDWQYGYMETVEEVKKIEKNYSKIVVSNRPHLDQSYIFFLFYLPYEPSTYHKEAKYASGGFRENHTFGKYEFRPIDWMKEEKSDDILYVGRPEDFLDAKAIKTIYFLDGTEAIKLVEGS